MGWGWYSGFAPYVSVAERKRNAAKEVKKLRKKGHICQPILLNGQTIAKTVWGKAWCKNMENYSDYSNRLPRGRTYVRNGSVIDLQIAPGEITALVSGSSIYKVKVSINKVVKNKWNIIVAECAGKIDSLIELLQGKFSQAVMQIITDPNKGLFPHPKEIKFNCSCPDGAYMCKHVAAVLYGIGARFDDKPEELFLLRQADHLELISKAETGVLLPSATTDTQTLAESDLGALFNIDIKNEPQTNTIPARRTKSKKKLSKKIKTNNPVKKQKSLRKQKRTRLSKKKP